MIQLKVRTEYSFGQTFAPIKPLVAHLKAMGCRAAGIVDSNTWGHVAWDRECREVGIQPLLGVECVVTDDEERLTKMWFLATTTAALSELYRAMSAAHRQAIKTKRGTVPRMFRADVRFMSEEIVKCAGDVVDAEFLTAIGAYADISPSSETLNALKFRLNRPLIYVSDNAYIEETDREVFEVMAKGGTKPTPQWLLPSLTQTEAMAGIVARSTGLKLPAADMIKAEGDLDALCREGIVARGLTELFERDARYPQRLAYELDIIKQKDYEAYFIIVADMVQFAKKHMLVGPSRGSAAGSLVCYLTRITEIDPIPPGLFFERFIDITRRDLPDIDLDFPDDKRHLVFEYMADKWGARKVAHIGTISKYKPKSALIQVCKALDIPPRATAGVKTAMIERSSADARANACLQDTLEQTEPGRAFLEAYPQAAICSRIEGHASHTGVHAAGLLICNKEIVDYCTVDQHGIAHIEMSGAYALGLLKIDVLGLRTLGVLEGSGVDIDWYRLPFDDPKTYEVFNAGRMCGIFQFEGQAMRSIAEQMDIDTISDVDAVTALARPGPFAGGVTHKYLERKKGVPYAPIHPLVQEHMKHTYGLPIYQEQTLAIVRDIGNFGWKEAATIRKAMSKSLGVQFFNQYWEQFKAGAATHGIEEGPAREIWEMIMTMGSWQMNKAHTYSYAVISYWCAYLKANHPLEFAASTLRNEPNEDRATELLREMVKEGIAYVPFDPMLSELNWSVKDRKLVGGFTALKGIGQIKAKKYIEAREAGRLTAADREKLLAMPNPFADLWPLRTKYRYMYEDPLHFGFFDKRWTIDDTCFVTLDKLAKGDGIEENVSYFFIAELIVKNPHNINEEPLVKKRGGERKKEEAGKMEYLDVRLRDDTATLGGRINRFDYMRIGLEITEKVPVGAHLMIRATFFRRNNEYIPYAFIKEWEWLDKPESIWTEKLQRYAKEYHERKNRLAAVSG